MHRPKMTDPLPWKHKARARSDGHHAGQKVVVWSWKEETDARVEAMSGSQSSGIFSWGDNEHEE